MYLLWLKLMGKDFCSITVIGKDFLFIDKLVKMYVLKVFIIGDICHFGLASLTEEP